MPPDQRQRSAGQGRSSERPSKPSNNKFDRMGERATEAIFLLLVFLALWGFLSGFIPKVEALFSQRQPSIASLVNSPVGQPVQLSSSQTVYADPGGAALGTQPSGAEGVVTKGPKFYDGQRYWYVDFASGPDGWVAESALQGAGGKPFNPGDTPVGSQVTIAGQTTLHATPGGAAIGTEPKGAAGTVTDGPQYANGQRYWYVSFADGRGGWVRESDLRNSKGGPFNPGSTIVGRAVEAGSNGVPYYSQPGGAMLGRAPAGEHGVALYGPEAAGGHRYWYVQFDSGQEGWVDENDLQLVQPPSPFSRFMTAVKNFSFALSTLLSLLFLTGIVYSVIRSSQVHSKQRVAERRIESPAQVAATAQDHVNRRWERVLAHVQSDSPADWRLAILEADIMLSELLERMGYAGENVGEKLKTIEKSDFNSIDDAWEAHKVRNIIAHQGSDYVLSRREAQRVVSLYANVFREFRYI